MIVKYRSFKLGYDHELKWGVAEHNPVYLCVTKQIHTSLQCQRIVEKQKESLKLLGHNKNHISCNCL
jgi:hypothetical protein